MEPLYRTYRNLEYSIQKRLQELLDTSFSSPTIPVRVGKKFKDDWTLPTVAVYWNNAPIERLGIGEHRWIETNTIIIDIFAKGEGLKLDLASLIVQGLRDGFDYYEVSKDPGDQSQLVETLCGTFHVTIIGNDPVTLGDNVDLRDRYRHRITILVETVDS